MNLTVRGYVVFGGLGFIAGLAAVIFMFHVLGVTTDIRGTTFFLGTLVVEWVIILAVCEYGRYRGKWK